MIVEIIQGMTCIDWIIFAVTIIAYLILIVDIFKNKGESQDFFTWLVWGILDSILFITTHKEQGSDLALIGGCVIGSFLVSLFLILIKKIKWEKDKTKILLLIIPTVTFWLWSKSNQIGIAFAVTSEIIAGIPLIKESWKNPGSKITLASYLIFIISYVLTIWEAPNWYMENTLFPIAFLFYSVGDTIPLIKKWVIKKQP